MEAIYMKYTMGLDVHKEMCVYALVNEQGKVQRQGEIKTNPKLLLELISPIPPSAIQVGMESSTYIYPLYDALNDAGYTIKVAHPAKLHRITQAAVKNDEKDALDLALQLLRNDFPESYMLSKEMRDYRELIRQHMVLTQQQTKVKNRIHSHLARYGYKISSALGTKKSIQFLDSLELPTNAKITLGVMISQLKNSKELLTTIDKCIKRFVESNEDAQKLMKLDGIGSFAAAAFCLELGDWRRFKSVKQLTAYVGMIPKMSGSANKMYYGRMRPDGNHHIRYAFTRAAEQAIRKQNQCKLYFDKLISKGKRRRTAISAVANKLIRISYGILHAEEPNYSGSLMEKG